MIEENKEDKQYLKRVVKDFVVENSDYPIRLKNNEEERIFSYDKPNKYRTDINTLAAIIDLLPSPRPIFE